MKPDSLFSIPRTCISDFAFDESVADVFPDMISRSVPGYGAMLAMIEQLAARFAKEDSNVYDLGASLGAATFRIQARSPASAVIHAVDNSSAMISRLRASVAAAAERQTEAKSKIECYESDICDFAMSNASMMVLNLTLQFVAVEKRASLLGRVFEALNPGGVLLLSEKVSFDEQAEQQLLADLHHDFKRANGYSDLEIAQKRTALENTLIAETLDEHFQRLRECGFQTVSLWFQCFNFASILAVKK